MGGEIAIESQEGQGSCVTFQLDFETVAALPEPDWSEEVEKRIVSRPLEVLVVEDDEINRTVCARYLELLGHTCLLAKDGTEALTTLEASGDRIDAVLMDISLPGMSGLEVAEHLRVLEGGKWRHLPVVIMSAHISTQAPHPAIGKDFAGFLGKPFSINALARALSGISDKPKDAPTPHGTADTHPGLLDFAYLTAELETLGATTLAELLMLFKNNLPTFFAEIDRHFAAGEWTELGARAHRLRSAAGNLGMTKVLACSRAAEKESTVAEPSRQLIESLLGELKAACVQSCEELYDWLLSVSEFESQG